MLHKTTIFKGVWLAILSSLTIQSECQIADNPPPNSFTGTYTSGTFVHCAWNANLSDLRISNNAQYTIRAGNSIRIQAGYKAPYQPPTPVPTSCHIGGFATGSFHAFIDPNYNLNGCSNVKVNLVWDNFYTGDGSIARESRPVEYQLYPRKANGFGDVVFAGTTSGCSGIAFKTVKTDFNNNISESIDNVGVVDDRFYFSKPIHAELSEYGFYYQLNGVGNWIKIAEHVVCGDAYLISGQSNATGEDLTATEVDNLNDTYGKNTAYGKYSRAYGSSLDPDGGFSPSLMYKGIWPVGFVGAWGLPLQYLIQHHYGIPTCVINGGWPGTRIDQHLPAPGRPFFNPGTTDPDPKDPEYPSTLLDRLNSRAYNAGLENDIKGIFWWQGDAGNTPGYISAFTPLYNEWNRFFPSFQKAYVVQIASYPESEVPLRVASEQQRNLPLFFQKVTVMSANGIGYHRVESGSAIHHQDWGYIALANRLFDLVKRDFYGETSNINDITPPNIQTASKIGNLITLCFDQNIYVNANSPYFDDMANVLSAIKFDTEIPPKNAIIAKSNPVISGQCLSFNISPNTPVPASVSYAGYIGSPFANHIDNNGANNYDYTCYLRNSKNIGALSFHNIPISQ